MSVYPIRVVRVSDDYPHSHRGDLLNAPRPLYGTEYDADIMGFTVIADDIHAERNLALDAHRIVFVTDSAAADATFNALSAEYGAAALADLSDDELIGMFRPEFLIG